MSEPRTAATWAARLVDRLGGHPVGALGIEPADGDAALLRWWVLALLLSSRRDASRAAAGYAALAEAGLLDLAALAAASPEAVAAYLETAGARDPKPPAARLVGSVRTLVERHGGSFERLARSCGSLEEIGARLAQLGRGIGAGTVARFLRPLRELWPAAAELPLSPAARAAACHVGLLTEGEDEEGEPAVLRRVLADAPGAPALRDVEAALERLGSVACLRERPERCRLAEECPARPR